MSDYCRRLLTVFVVAVVFPMSHAVFASQPGVTVTNAWLRWLPGDLPMAGYFTLQVEGDHDMTLLNAHSDAFDSVMIHRTISESGMDRMEHIDTIPVSAGDTVTFEPGGYHLMLQGRRRELNAGDTIDMQLYFKGGKTLPVTFTVRGAAG